MLAGCSTAPMSPVQELLLGTAQGGHGQGFRQQIGRRPSLGHPDHPDHPDGPTYTNSLPCRPAERPPTEALREAPPTNHWEGPSKSPIGPSDGHFEALAQNPLRGPPGGRPPTPRQVCADLNQPDNPPRSSWGGAHSCRRTSCPPAQASPAMYKSPPPCWPTKSLLAHQKPAEGHPHHKPARYQVHEPATRCLPLPARPPAHASPGMRVSPPAWRRRGGPSQAAPPP
jgi:hypothetical protein